jgi:ABC-type sugar transport system ATPase subunit
MAAPPLLQLTDLSLTFGGNPLFDGVTLVLQPRDRLALVGRNGSGKSPKPLPKKIAGSHVLNESAPIDWDPVPPISTPIPTETIVSCSAFFTS